MINLKDKKKIVEKYNDIGLSIQTFYSMISGSFSYC